MKITIGSRAFSSKRDAKEFFTSRLKNYWGKTLLPEDDELLFNLFKRHPEFTTKFGKPAKVKFSPTSENKSTHITIKYDDGTLDDISWNLCIHQNRRALDIANMRKLIEHQVKKFKLSQKELSCAECNSATDIHVDHVVSFKTLLEKFKVEHPELDDAAWISFHEKNAVLQLLCAPCNYKKGA